MKWGINDTKHCTINDVWFLTHCCNTIDYKTSHNNIRVILSAANTIIEETTFTDAQGTGVMRDVLFRYENNVTNKEGVYFDMDGNGIKEKMLTWTDPNQWMVVGNNIWIESKNTRSVA